MHYDDYLRGGIKPDDEDNVIAALEHPDRLYRVCLAANELLLGKIIAMMQKPCPILTCLSIVADDRNVLPLVLPAGFLGRSAPCLQGFRLCAVPFPALPTLLLSASNLVDLTLTDIPPTGYTSPEEMVVYLTTLPRLKTLHLRFQIVTSYSARILPAPVERTVLPSLRELTFSGVFEYLEDLVAQVDIPQLSLIYIDYFDQGIDFEVPQLSEFFDRSENLKKILSNECKIMICDDLLYFDVFGGATTTDKSGLWNCEDCISFCIRCEPMDQKISQLTNVLSWISPIISDIVHFHLQSDAFIFEPEDLEDVDWLGFLHQFSSVQTMLICGNGMDLISHCTHLKISLR